MANEGQLIDDSHIDVILYYLRKKAMYFNFKEYQFTAVDCNFSAFIQGIWQAYGDLDGGACNARLEKTIKEYINGRMQAAVSWHTVDNVFILMNMKEKFYWFLIVMCFQDRTIYIYDSIRYIVHDELVLNEVKNYAQLISMYLASLNFYEKKGLDLTEHPKYKSHKVRFV